MYCVDLISFNGSQVKEWHDGIEQLSPDVRTHSGRIKLLVTRRHRPVGSRHNKNTSLLRLSGQLERLPSSAGLLCLFSQIGSGLRTYWWDSLYCIITDKRLTILVLFVFTLLIAKRFSAPCVSLSVWELESEWALINILRARILRSFCTVNLSSQFLVSHAFHGLTLVCSYMMTRSSLVWRSPGWCLNADVNYWENSSAGMRSVTKEPFLFLNIFFSSFFLLLAHWGKAVLGIWFESIVCPNAILHNRKYGVYCENVL